MQAGKSLHVLQELAAWACVETVRKYAHLASDRLQVNGKALGQALVEGVKSTTRSHVETIEKRLTALELRHDRLFEEQKKSFTPPTRKRNLKLHFDNGWTRQVIDYETPTK